MRHLALLSSLRAQHPSPLYDSLPISKLPVNLTGKTHLQGAGRLRGFRTAKITIPTAGICKEIRIHAAHRYSCDYREVAREVTRISFFLCTAGAYGIFDVSFHSLQWQGGPVPSRLWCRCGGTPVGIPNREFTRALKRDQQRLLSRCISQAHRRPSSAPPVPRHVPPIPAGHFPTRKACASRHYHISHTISIELSFSLSYLRVVRTCSFLRVVC